MTRLASLLRLDALTWSAIDHRQLAPKITIVVFGYIVMAWNRFGLLGFTAPRAPVRMLLVGFYGWAALSLALWLVLRLRHPAGRPRLADLATGVGYAHFPLIVLGAVIAVLAGFLRILGPGLVVAVFVFAFWVPGLLVRAVTRAGGVSVGQSAAVVAVPYLLWLALAGRYLEERVGHLL